MRTLTHTTETVTIPTTGTPCGSPLQGDWDTVECVKCGLRVNTLDLRVNADEVLRLDAQGYAVAVVPTYA